jgi:hypothetical protein
MFQLFEKGCQMRPVESAAVLGGGMLVGDRVAWA